MSSIPKKVYAEFKGILTCGQVGGDSLYINPQSVVLLKEIFEISECAHILWIGCGDAREAISFLAMDPRVCITAIDIEWNCIDGARIGFENVIRSGILSEEDRSRLHLSTFDAMDLSPCQPQPFTHIYTYAIPGPDFYRHVLRIAIESPSVEYLIAHTPFWRGLGIGPQTTFWKNKIAEHVVGVQKNIRMNSEKKIFHNLGIATCRDILREVIEL